jgi:ribosome maturation factor RimP
MHAELPTPSSLPDRIDPSRLKAVIEPVVSAHEAELSDVELTNENGWVLRVYVERAGAQADKLTTKAASVDLEQCSNIARGLSVALDEADPIPHPYTLEVGSPGVERPLRTRLDFERFVGEKAKLKLRQGVAGQHVLTGRITGVTPIATAESGTSTQIALEERPGSALIQVPFDDVVSARLVFEYGATPKAHRGADASKSKKSPNKTKKRKA